MKTKALLLGIVSISSPLSAFAMTLYHLCLAGSVMTANDCIVKSISQVSRHNQSAKKKAFKHCAKQRNKIIDYCVKSNLRELSLVGCEIIPPFNYQAPPAFKINQHTVACYKQYGNDYIAACITKNKDSAQPQKNTSTMQCLKKRYKTLTTCLHQAITTPLDTVLQEVNIWQYSFPFWANQNPTFTPGETIWTCKTPSIGKRLSLHPVKVIKFTPDKKASPGSGLKNTGMLKVVDKKTNDVGRIVSYYAVTKQNYHFPYPTKKQTLRYKNRKIIADIIEQYYPTIVFLAKKRAGKTIPSSTFVKALKAPPQKEGFNRPPFSKQQKFLTASIKGHQVQLNFNKLLLGKPFQLLLTPKIEMPDAIYYECQTSSIDKKIKYQLPSICRETSGRSSII